MEVGPLSDLSLICHWLDFEGTEVDGVSVAKV